MAFFSFFLIFVLLLVVFPIALSETCKAHKFKTPNKEFSDCADLPHLSAALHYSFNASACTLSMAFSAAPSKPSGWVAWGINPTADGMAGADTILAYINASSVALSTFHLQSYSNISLISPATINVSGISGESSSDGKITVFATWNLPADVSSVNQVWQVGPSVSSTGVPARHDFEEANLKAKSKLELIKALAKSDPAESPAAAPADGKNAASEGPGRLGVLMGLVLGAVLSTVLLL